MGILCDYFSAASDEEAAAVVDRIGGPGSQAVEQMVAPARQPGLLRFRKAAPRPVLVDDPELPMYDTVNLRGIEPTVQLGTLEEILTGRAFDEILEDLDTRIVAEREDGEGLVCRLSAPLTNVLAGATRERLQTAAETWSTTEEFAGDADPADLAATLADLADLARRATGRGHQLYCWICF